MQTADNLYEVRKGIFGDFEKYGYKYIARDKDGALFSYSDEPIKQERIWRATSMDSTWQDISFVSSMFADIKWEDKNPFEIPWANWKDVPADTKVIVTGADGSEWKCHFYKKLNDNSILVFIDGKTSWTTDDVVEVDIDNVRLE